VRRRAYRAFGDLGEHVPRIDDEVLRVRRHRNEIAPGRAHLQPAIVVLGEDSEEAVVLVLGGAEFSFRHIAVGRIMEQAHEGDRLVVARA
jgi:hypothetical protein